MVGIRGRFLLGRFFGLFSGANSLLVSGSILLYIRIPLFPTPKYNHENMTVSPMDPIVMQRKRVGCLRGAAQTPADFFWDTFWGETNGEGLLTSNKNLSYLPIWAKITTLPETNIGPERKQSYSNHHFSGATLVSGRVYKLEFCGYFGEDSTYLNDLWR